jgi:hypothetical protein
MPLAIPRVPIPLGIGPTQVGIALPVPYVHQCQTEWCWAACASMILNYYKNNMEQCAVAGLIVGIDCCAFGGLCNRPADPGDISEVFTRSGLSSSAITGPVTVQQLLDELQAARPVEIAVGPCTVIPGEPSGHALVIYGWMSDTIFRVHDPLDEGSGRADYSAIMQGMSRGCWRNSWTGIQQLVAAKGVDFGESTSTDTSTN